MNLAGRKAVFITTMKKFYLIFLIMILFSAEVFSEPLTLKYFQTDHRYNYRIDLLKLSMDKTSDSDGPYTLAPVKYEMTQTRGISYLEKGDKINIGFFPSNKERELKLLSIKIPILRGLLGYRVSIIHKDSLSDFSKIESLDQLRTKYKAGFVNQWADFEILQINNIGVVGVSNYEFLFQMLALKRFD